MTSTILVVEDNDERIASFQVYLRRYDFTIVKSADEAIDLLAKKKYDLVMLDHDLGDGYKTGTDVAEFIATLPEEGRPGSCILHTHNFVGAKRMKEILESVGITTNHKPFR